MKVSRPGDAPLPYELDFVANFGELSAVGGSTGAVLRSPMLDPALHPGGSARVTFGSRRPTTEGAEEGFVLESFQMDSLAEYLRAQAHVRKTLEVELAELDPRPAPARSAGAKSAGVWRRAEVFGVSMYGRDVPSPAVVAATRRREGKQAARELVESQDKSTTRSTFLVYVRYGHGDYLAIFRDAALVSFESL
jgi:hypothetical protein